MMRRRHECYKKWLQICRLRYDLTVWHCVDPEISQMAKIGEEHRLRRLKLEQDRAAARIRPSTVAALAMVVSTHRFYKSLETFS